MATVLANFDSKSETEKQAIMDELMALAASLDMESADSKAIFEEAVDRLMPGDKPAPQMPDFSFNYMVDRVGLIAGRRGAYDVISLSAGGVLEDTLSFEQSYDYVRTLIALDREAWMRANGVR